MFRYLRVKRQPEKVVSDLGRLSGEWLTRSPGLPITLRQINGLPENAKRRAYRGLLPPSLLVRFGINPVTWQAPDGEPRVLLEAGPDTGVVKVSVRDGSESADEFFYLELQDTSLNGINLNFLLLSDPKGPSFRTDYDEEGNPTLFGSVRRNLAAEEQAMKAGLAPAQVRKGLGASRLVVQQLEAFLVTCGHVAFFTEPLTYTSAWLFERRGFAYVRGHKLMDDIQNEFQPRGRLHRALDGSTPFRQPDQWRTVRGRAWAIHDGVLSLIDASWNDLRMVKQAGREAGVETFPDAVY
jgi:hypothetical protein